MSYAASIQSTAGTVATYAKKMAHGQPDMEIFLDNHVEGKIYTTFDAICGRVNITAPHNARFDEIRITLEGSTKAFVENFSPASTRSRTTATHNFLKLVMPIRESDYPQPRIAEAGRTYTFSFNFVIPDELLPRACAHEVKGDHVHDAHVQLPPSLGIREVSLLDDLAPEMSKVQYAIKVKVIRTRERDGKDVELVEGQKRIRVIPAVTEAPPMSLGDGYDDYVLSKTKSLKKGVFKGKLGKITVSAAQTGAFILPAPSSTNTTSPTTVATLNLRFDPHEASSEPPRLGGLTTKIKTSTFFAARPAQAFPTRHMLGSQFETTRGVYETSIPLSSRCVEAVAWKKQEAKPATDRRNSDSSVSSSDCSDDPSSPDVKENAMHYSATVLVPITLPTSKAWVPTFHSCIASRVYAIDLTLTIHTPGTAVPASSVTLHLPVQIAATGNQTERAPMTAAEAAAELADANEFLRPRMLSVPNEEHIGNSVLAATPSDLPPSYESFSPPRVVVEPGRS